MAASVEGAFILLDRASGSLRSMRHEAERTDAAFMHLGDTMDKRVSTNQQLRSMERNTQVIRNYGRASTTASGDVDRFSSSSRRASKEAGTFTDRIRSLGGAFIGLRAIMRPAMFGAMAVGIGVAVQAVSALSAGAVSLIPKLTDAAGAAAALPAVFGGMALAMGTVKLATKDLAQAYGGNAQALKRLTPQAREFLSTLKDFAPVVNRVRSAAQRGLFPGLTDALVTMRQLEPLAARLTQRMGRQLGNQVSGFADLLAGRQRDLGTLGNQGVRVVGRMGEGIRNLSAALIDVAVAARPFTDWLTKTMLGWTLFIRRQAEAGRESGRLARYFDRTRDSLEQLGRIAQNLWGTFTGIGHASRSLGDSLYDGIEKATGRWDRWANSFRGQNWLRRWFADSREPIFQISGLVADIGKSIATFDMTGLTDTVKSLRRGVEPLQTGLETLATNFGPQLADGIVQVLRLLTQLTGSGGALSMMLGAFTNILTTVNDLAEAIPGLGRLLSAGLLVAGLARLNSGIGKVARGWRSVESSALRAAAAQERAAGTATTGVVAGAAGRRGVATMNPFAAYGGYGGWRSARRVDSVIERQRRFYGTMGAPAGNTPMIGMPGQMTRAERWQRVQAQRAARTGTPAAVGAGALAGNVLRGGLGASRAALAGMASFMAPLAGLGALLGAMQGGGGYGSMGLLRNTLSGASMGLLPSTGAVDDNVAKASNQRVQGIINANPSGRTAASLAGSLRGLATSRAGIERQLAGPHQSFLSSINPVGPANGITKAREKELRTSLKAIKDEQRARRELLPQLRAEERARSNQRGHDYADRASQAFGIAVRRRGAAGAIQSMTGDIAGIMGQRQDRGARVIAQQALNRATDAASRSRDPRAARRALVGLRGAIRDRFAGRGVGFDHGQVILGSDVGRLRGRVRNDPVERERQRGNDGPTRTQSQLITAYIAGGMAPGDARDVVMRAGGPGGRTHRPNAGRPGVARTEGMGRGPGAAPQALLRHANKGQWMGLSPKEADQTKRRHKDTASAIKRDSDDTQRKIVGDNRIVERSTRERWGNAATAMIRSSSRAQRDVGTAMTGIRTNLMTQLDGLGLSRGERSRVLTGGGGGKAHTSGAASTLSGGSNIGGLPPAGDGTGIGGGAGPRTGDGPGRGGARQRRAGGGGGGGGINLMGANPNLGGYAQIGASMGLQVTSGARPGAITASGNTSYHSSGHAIDMSGSGAAMLHYAHAMASRYGSQLDELIHTPLGYGIKNGKKVPLSFWGPTINAMHGNHVHVADKSPGRGGPAAGGGGQVRARRVRAAPGSGALGALAAGTANAYGGAAQHAVNRRLASIIGMGGDMDVRGGGLASAGGMYNKRELRRLWIKAGGPRNVAGTAAAIALAESGGNPSIINSIGATGLWQIYNGNGAVPGATNPMTNARMAVAKYNAAHGFTPWTTYTGADTPGHAKTYLKYMGDGIGMGPDRPRATLATAPRPRLDATGDGTGIGVLVAPRRRGGRRSAPSVSIGAIHVANHRPGDIRRQIEKEVAEAFAEYADSYDALDPDDGVEGVD